MKLLRRRQPPDPAAIANETAAMIERERALAQLRREQAEADRRAEQQRRADAEQERARHREEAAARRARRYARLVAIAAALRTVAPLLVVNTATIGGQLVYAYSETPADWPDPIRVACAIVYALAAETVALYVGWHAHDALLQGAHATAAKLRRTSYLIAAVFGALNYSHFAGEHLAPTAFAIALGTLSLLSPWLWGLHTRRAQHVQLLAEDANLIDTAGAEFSAERRRAFPVRSWLARRWSIDHYVRDPRRAWDGYNRDRARRRAATPPGRIRAAVTVLRGQPLPALAGQPVAIGGGDPDVRELCDLVLAQARAARYSLATGARQFYLPTGQQADHPDAPTLAIPGGHDSGQSDGQDQPAAEARSVAGEVAKPPARRVVTAVARKPAAIDPATVARIRRAAKRKSQPTPKQLADEFGVSESTVRRILGLKK